MNCTTILAAWNFAEFINGSNARTRKLGERLNAHRKRQQKLHPDLTMTGIYNILEKLKAGQELNAKERVIHEQGLVSVLKQIHDELDAAVFQDYGWPATISDEEILERLVALNKERAAEEARGLTRWLRPEYQAPSAQQPQVQGELAGMTEPALASHAPAENQPWPTALAAQAQAVRQAQDALAAQPMLPP